MRHRSMRGIGWRYELQEYIPAKNAIGNKGYWSNVPIQGDAYAVDAAFHRLKAQGREVRVVRITTELADGRIVEPKED